MDAEDIIKILIIIVVLLVAVGSCARGVFVSENRAIKALETQGFSNVTITDHAWFCIFWRGGEKSDAARFTAIAINPAGKKVKVYVFSGLIFKGATIRSL